MSRSEEPRTKRVLRWALGGLGYVGVFGGVLGVGNERVGIVVPLVALFLPGVVLVIATNQPGTSLGTTWKVLAVVVAILVATRIAFELATR